MAEVFITFIAVDIFVMFFYLSVLLIILYNVGFTACSVFLFVSCHISRFKIYK